MKVLLLNGSGHPHGCTDLALREVAGSLNARGVETEILWIGAEPLAGCIGCGHCGKAGRCFREDMVNEVASRMEEFDGLVVGSPVHYAAASGQITSFMDRLFMLAGKKMAGKVGAAVVACRRGGASAAFDQLNKYFTISNMPIAPSQYWNQIHGSNPAEAAQDLEGLQTMRTLGENMAWLLQCIQAGDSAGVVRPQYEATIRTSFIR